MAALICFLEKREELKRELPLDVVRFFKAVDERRLDPPPVDLLLSLSGKSGGGGD